MVTTKTCFVIAPIGEPESETRKRSDQILRHVIVPAMQVCGYDPLRADRISEPGLITSQVIQHIMDDPLLIADLTERNPNVFYELALRHAIRKPFVQLIEKGEALPFDVAGTRTIQVDHHDLDSVATAKVEIINQVKALEKASSPIESPISVSIDLQLLRQSSDPEQRSLGDLMSSISTLQTGISAIGARLDKADYIDRRIDERIFDIHRAVITITVNLKENLDNLELTIPIEEEQQGKDVEGTKYLYMIRQDVDQLRRLMVHMDAFINRK